MSRRLTLCLALLGILALTAPLTVTGAGKGTGEGEKAKHIGLVEVGDDYNEGRPLPVRGLKSDLRASGSSARASGAETPDVGSVQSWVALDDFAGVAYLKDFTLRGVGENIEVWVASEDDVQTDENLPAASDLDFPEGDCRNGPRTQITDEQVAYFISEFDTNIYPLESAAFSVPPERDGTGEGLFGPELTRPGDGGNIVVLVDNVRDANFYDTNNSQGLSYIAGFFWSFTNDIHDRNIMNIDAFDWIHRTTANPPHEPSEDLCTSAPARPFLYEGVFAHEYQHLLEHYEDPAETTWLNEGLSDWAQTLTGYVDPSTPITEIGFDSHVQCFLGWLGVQTDANPIPRDGGPENSLTLWGDQTDYPWEILCDYGAAYTIMELLAGRYGQDFMTYLHRDDAGGLESLDGALNAFGKRASARRILHQWAVAVAIDGLLDEGGKVRGRKTRKYQVPTLNATINWDTPDAYQTPGAPPNGSDYVRLRDADGEYVVARDIDSISFDGAETLPPQPVEWTVDANPPDRAGDAALYSGSGDNLDRAIVREVSVPADAAALTFDTKYVTEHQWDYGFVQASTDGGGSYTSISCPGMNSDHDPAAIPAVQENVPGFSGDSGGWTTVTCDLAAYAAQTILLSFRYVTDAVVTEPGWWIDNVSVGGTLVSDGSTLEGWQSPTQVNPIEVDDFTVQLVAWDERGRRVTVSKFRLDDDHERSFTVRGRHGGLNRLVNLNATHVGAIVMYDEPTESISQYAPYSLRVNGVLQPGGS